ncbi:MAG: two-component regulator propeller domain-containing protein [Bacteroidota bacterium]
MRRFILIGFLLAGAGSVSWGQQFGLPHVKRYTISEGLSNNSVFSLVQDQRGFLWIATGDGLSRYDGYSFTRFRHQAQDSSSLTENHISSLVMGREGTLWVGTQVKGLNQYVYQRNLFRAALATRISNQFIHPGRTVILAPDSGLVAATDRGVYHLASAQAESLTWQLPGASVRCLLPESRTSFLAGSNLGLHRLSYALDSVEEVIAAKRVGKVRALAYDQAGNLFIGTQTGLFYLSERDPSTLQRIPDFQGRLTQINAIHADRRGNIWVGGDNGLAVLDAEKRLPLLAENRVLSQNGLDQERVECLFVDREDNLWIGTASDGLIRLFLSAGHFPLYRPAQLLPAPNPAGNTIRAILAEDNGHIWIGSYGSWLYRYRSQGDWGVDLIPESYRMGDNILSALFRDQAGRLWVGTWNNGLFYGSEKPGKLAFIQHPFWQGPGPGQEYLQSIQRVFEDEYGFLWVISNGGILRKNPQSSTFQEVSSFFPQSTQSINAFWEDHQGNWWFGTWNGLYRYSPEQIHQARWQDNPPPEGLLPLATYHAGQGELSDERVTSIMGDPSGGLWIGTYGGGLNLLKDGHIRYFEEPQGLPNNIVYGIEIDSLQRLWISTNNGLALFDPSGEQFRVFTEDDGLQNNQFYFGGHAKTTDGRLIMGGIKGFNLFRPEAYTLEGPHPPAVNLTDFQVRGVAPPLGSREDGTVVMDSSILLCRQLTLQPYDDAFRIDFSALTFNHATKLQFAYQLEGFDPDWRLTDYQNRFAVYGNLYEGDYTFLVKASLNGKDWGPVRKLHLEVLPPWYRTWWAGGILMGLIILIILAVGRISYVYSNLQNQLRVTELEREQEAEIYNLRLWFFTGISHEFRTPLTLIMSPLSELINRHQLAPAVRQKLQLIHRSSQRLLRLVNQILNLRRLKSGELSLNVAEQDLVSFAKDIFFSFYDHADTRGLRYDFQCSQDQISLWFDAEKMEIILYNLLANAFKYSQASGTVTLLLAEQEQEVIIEVRDQGIGIPAERMADIFKPFKRVENSYSGFGIGLALVKSLVEMHQSRIEVQSEVNQGTCFRLSWLKGKDHFAPSDLDLAPAPPAVPPAIPMGSPETAFSVFPASESGEKPSILLVEDDPEIRRYFAQHFWADFTVLEASNGEEGLAKALEHLPDLIISDVMMPVMDGVALCRKLEAEISTRQIPIILLTARSAPVHQIQGLQSGAIAYLSKPVDVALLRERAVAILRHVRQMQQAYQQEGILPLAPERHTQAEKFVRKAAQLVEANLAAPDLTAQSLADKMGMGRSNLYKKLMAATGKSTTQFIRYLRLRHAEKLLLEGNHNISEAAYQVGFGDLKYFRKCFKQEFGLTPSEYLRREGKGTGK